jgi:hypothetical protein
MSRRQLLEEAEIANHELLEDALMNLPEDKVFETSIYGRKLARCRSAPGEVLLTLPGTTGRCGPVLLRPNDCWHRHSRARCILQLRERSRAQQPAEPFGGRPGSRRVCRVGAQATCMGRCPIFAKDAPRAHHQPGCPEERRPPGIPRPAAFGCSALLLGQVLELHETDESGHSGHSLDHPLGHEFAHSHENAEHSVCFSPSLALV